MAWSFSTNVNEILSAAARRPAKVATAIRRHPSSVASADMQAPVELLRSEIARARRYERNVGVIRLPVRDADAGEIVRGVLRETDRVAADQRGLVVVLPETEPQGVRICAERLASSFGLDIHLVGIVAFPDDALTVGLLWELLEDRMGAREASGRADVAPWTAA